MLEISKSFFFFWDVFLASFDLPSADTNKGTENVSNKNTKLETYKGINLDTNKVSNKIPEMRTGSGMNKSQDNKTETDKDANGNSDKSSI